MTSRIRNLAANLTPLVIPPPVVYDCTVQPENLPTKEAIEDALRTAMPYKQLIVTTGLNAPRIEQLPGASSTHYVRVLGVLTQDERNNLRVVMNINFGFL